MSPFHFNQQDEAAVTPAAESLSYLSTRPISSLNAYRLGYFAMISLARALFKFVFLFGIGMSLINVYARKDTLSNTSEHNYYSYFESHGIMKEQTGRAVSLTVYKSMLGLVRLSSALNVAFSIGLNGMLTLMVVIYPTDISLSPANFPGNKVVGIFLLIVGLATSIASAIYFWKAASQLSRSVTAQH